MPRIVIGNFENALIAHTQKINKLDQNIILAFEGFYSRKVVNPVWSSCQIVFPFVLPLLPMHTKILPYRIA